MSGTSMNPAAAGLFATARKGGLTNEEIHEIEAHRAKARPTPWPALAKRYGRCEADLRAYFAPKHAPDPPPPPAVTAGDALASALRAGAVGLRAEDAERLLALASELDGAK